MRPLTNKASVVVALLRDAGEMSCKTVAETVTANTPCGHCDGTGRATDGDGDDVTCKRCYGRGRRHFSYSTAYVALVQLEKRGLVTRRRLLDEWGDETDRLVWKSAPVADASADELEAMYAAPSRESSAS